MIELLLLRNLLENLVPEADDVDALRPCKFFDVIGEFSIGEAIKAFSKFTEAVFKEDGGMKKALKDGNMFELSRLEDAIDSLLQDRSKDLMYQPDVPLACRVSLP
jgi:hypothetical protein